MPVYIDPRLCDNAQGCGSARACPTGAISFDRSEGKIVVDNLLCNNCNWHPCTSRCPAGAVKWGSTMADVERLERESQTSTKSKDDLLAERYGVRPGDPRELGQNLFHVNDANFQSEVLNSATPVVIDFWAEWCAPCRILAPTFKTVAAQYDGRVRFAKLDTEEAPSISGRYGVMSIPTMLFFHQGQVVHRLVGAVPKAQLEKAVEAVLQATGN